MKYNLQISNGAEKIVVTNFGVIIKPEFLKYIKNNIKDFESGYVIIKKDCTLVRLI